MKSYILLLFFACSLTVAMGQHAAANGADTDSEVNQWFTAREWLGKTDLLPDASINKSVLYNSYHRNKARWERAFDFLTSEDLAALEIGTHELMGKDLFVIVSEYRTKDSKAGYYESHRKYTDIQYVVSGEEYIDVRDTAGLTTKAPYDSDKDIVFYNEQNPRSRLAHPGVFFIFSPTEIHRPGIRVKESKLTKKVVIKVRND